MDNLDNHQERNDKSKLNLSFENESRQGGNDFDAPVRSESPGKQEPAGLFDFPFKLHEPFSRHTDHDADFDREFFDNTDNACLHNAREGPDHDAHLMRQVSLEYEN